MSRIFVHLDDPNTGELSCRADIKGARWRGGFKGNAKKKIAPFDQVMAEADKALGAATPENPHDIEFVLRRN